MRSLLLVLVVVLSACANEVDSGDAEVVVFEAPLQFAERANGTCGPIEAVDDPSVLCADFGGVYWEVSNETFFSLACYSPVTSIFHFHHGRKVGKFELETDHCVSTYDVTYSRK